MYSAEIICKKCGHILYFQEKELWRIVSIANDLEIEIVQKNICCNLCQEIGPMHLIIKNILLDMVFFEKIISPIPYGTYGKSPTELWTNTTNNTSGFKPTINNSCTVCYGTGKLEIQYKAHKKEGNFKGILIEECPICEGKGYFSD